MLIPVVMWELKSLNAPKITPGFSVPLPLIHPAQQKVCSAAAADILATLSLLRYHRKLKISVSTHTRRLAQCCFSKVNAGGGT